MKIPSLKVNIQQGFYSTLFLYLCGSLVIFYLPILLTFKLVLFLLLSGLTLKQGEKSYDLSCDHHEWALNGRAQTLHGQSIVWQDAMMLKFIDARTRKKTRLFMSKHQFKAADWHNLHRAIYLSQAKNLL